MGTLSHVALANRVKELRIALGLTQEKLQSDFLKREEVSTIEKGEKSNSYRAWKGLAVGFDMSLDDFDAYVGGRLSVDQAKAARGLRQRHVMLGLDAAPKALVETISSAAPGRWSPETIAAVATRMQQPGCLLDATEPIQEALDAAEAGLRLAWRTRPVDTIDQDMSHPDVQKGKDVAAQKRRERASQPSDPPPRRARR